MLINGCYVLKFVKSEEVEGWNVVNIGMSEDVKFWLFVVMDYLIKFVSGFDVNGI